MGREERGGIRGARREGEREGMGKSGALIRPHRLIVSCVFANRVNFVSGREVCSCRPYKYLRRRNLRVEFSNCHSRSNDSPTDILSRDVAL